MGTTAFQNKYRQGDGLGHKNKQVTGGDTGHTHPPICVQTTVFSITVKIQFNLELCQKIIIF